jgi:A/G-specific adenine glycosylase
VANFASKLVAWQRRHGRRDLPWQGTRDPYRVWLSEIMLQQTQVSTVIPYYQRFLETYPTVEALASASEDEVLQLWSGLGYYARGRNLHAAARELAVRFPDSVVHISQLPGVGRTTAAAIAVFAFGRRAAILDGNVKRVLARCFGVEGEKRLWPLAERLLPKRAIRVYTQALMDLGATVCARSRPRCDECPVKRSCFARKHGLTAKLPSPRRRAALPQRAVRWLVLRRGRQVLLEKRPSPGIWGGLWSFPEANGTDVKADCRRRFRCEIKSQGELAPIDHGFTHFKLRITPIVCDVKRVLGKSDPRRWIELTDAAQAAVPQPVRTLLGRLAEHSVAPGARPHRRARAAPVSPRAARAALR